MPTGNWVEITPGTRPPARSYGAMAYDGVSDTVILFGGLDATSTRLNDTRAWDGTNWSTLTPLTVPTARYGMAYTSILDVPYMFGGETSGPTLKDELYWFDGTDWVLEISFGLIPPARKYAALAQDENNRPLLWGGFTGGAFDSTVWIYDAGVGWLQRFPSTQPEPRMKHAMYYDPERGSVVMFGGISLPISGDPGVPLNDAWEWKGNDWHSIVLPVSPPARAAVMAYDPVLKRTVLGPGGTPASGHIVTLDSIYLNDGEDFTLNDGLNPAVPFELDDDSAVTPGAVLVDISGDVDASAMRDRILLAINGVGAGLLITAHPDGDDRLSLIHDLIDSRGNQSSSTTVSNTNFIVSDMSGAVGSTWTFNGSGGLWSEQRPATQVPHRDGAMLAFMGKTGEKVVMVWGGTVAGVASDTQYEWVWSSLGVSPYFSYPGVLQGRVQPQATQATDGQWAMVLGSDHVQLPDFMLNIGDEITVEQQLNISGHKLIRFDWRMRFSPDLPQYAMLVAGSAVDFYAPTKAPTNPDLVTLVPGAPPYADIEFRIPAALYVGDPGLQRFTMVYRPTGARREALGVPGSSPAVVRAGDLMEQTGVPSTATGDYLLSIGDSGLVRTLNNGGDRLIGCSVNGATPFLPKHEQQLVDIIGASDAGNNGTALRISAVPSEAGDVGAFDAGASAALIPAGRVAVLENPTAVKRLSSIGVNDAVSLSVRGAQWRAQCFVDIGGGDVLRGELVENLVQADPDGWQRGRMAAHISKVSGVSTLKFVLKLESVTA